VTSRTLRFPDVYERNPTAMFHAGRHVVHGNERSGDIGED